MHLEMGEAKRGGVRFFPLLESTGLRREGGGVKCLELFRRAEIETDFRLLWAAQRTESKGFATFGNTLIQIIYFRTFDRLTSRLMTNPRESLANVSFKARGERATTPSASPRAAKCKFISFLLLPSSAEGPRRKPPFLCGENPGEEEGEKN